MSTIPTRNQEWTNKITKNKHKIRCPNFEVDHCGLNFHHQVTSVADYSWWGSSRDVNGRSNDSRFVATAIVLTNLAAVARIAKTPWKLPPRNRLFGTKQFSSRLWVMMGRKKAHAALAIGAGISGLVSRDRYTFDDPKIEIGELCRGWSSGGLSDGTPSRTAPRTIRLTGWRTFRRTPRGTL